MSAPESTSTDAATFVLAADLSPAAAAEAKDGLVAALAAAESSKTPLSIEVDGETSTPCAMQLLVATKRSAESANVELLLSEQADALLANIHAD